MKKRTYFLSMLLIAIVVMFVGITIEWITDACYPEGIIGYFMDYPHPQQHIEWMKINHEPLPLFPRFTFFAGAIVIGGILISWLIALSLDFFTHKNLK